MKKAYFFLILICFLSWNTSAQTLSATPSSISFGPVTVSTSSMVELFSLNGSGLTSFPGNITVTAPSNYLISLEGSTWTSTLAVPFSSATLAATTIWVRFVPTATGIVCGNITISGGGATTINVAVCGTGATSCGGVPTAGTATISPTSGNSSTLFTLGLSGLTEGGITYQWRSAPAATGPYTDIPGATHFTYSFSGLSATTYYKCNVTCAWTTTVTASSPVTATYTPPTYCTPTYGSPVASCTTYNMYSRINLLTGYSGTINDATACNSTGYLDNSSMSCTLLSGTTYSVNVQTGYSCCMSSQIYIDMDGDGTFSPTEVVGGTATGYGSPGTTYSITIPGGAAPGTYRMRLVGNYMLCCGGLAYPNISACPTSAVAYGEARDYTVVIQSATCTTPPAISGASSVCVSANTTLTDATAAGTWSSSNTGVGTVSSSGVVAGISAGTTVISYTVSGGCYVTKSMTVNPPASAGTITGTATMCVGTTTTLTNTTTGGVWSSGTTGVATVTSTGTVTGVSAGTATISYTVTNGCGPMSATKIVTVTAGSPPITGIKAICLGYTTTLTTTASGGTWISSTPASVTVNALTGIATGVALGTATITYTLGGSCYSTAQVTVNSTLPNEISGATNICIAGTTTFTHPQPGGVWTSSNTSQATVNSSTGFISGVAAGTPTITYNVGGCFKTKSITVNANSGAPISGTTALCIGNTTVMSYPIVGAAWSSSNPSVATIGVTSGVVTGITAGTSLISFLGTTGCTTSTLMTILPLPTAISGSSTVCQSAFTTLSSIGTTGGTWISSNTAKASIGSASGIVNGLSNGTTMITYTWTNTCRRTATMSVNPLPIAGAIVGAGSLAVGGSMTLTPSVSGGTWASSNTAVATVVPTTGSICMMTGISAGSVTITYTNANGCGSAFVTRTFSVVVPKPGAPTDIGINIPFSVFPNPTSGTVNIQSPVSGAFKVYSLDGRQVAQYTITDAITSLTLPSHLTTGIYMCRFNGDDGSTVMVKLVYEP